MSNKNIKKKAPTGVPEPGRQERAAAWLKSPATMALARDLGLALLGGTLIALAFPHFDLWFLAWLGPALILAATRERRGWSLFRVALLGGATANLIGFFWMNHLLTVFGHLPSLPSLLIVAAGATYQAISIGAAYTAAYYVSRRSSISLVWTLPVFYTAFEYFHPILFPWYLGNCQYQQLWLTQVADLVGISGVTFLVLQGNAALYLLYEHLRKRQALTLQALGPGVTIAAALVYGVVRLAAIDQEDSEAKQLKVAVVEPEIGILEEQRKLFPPDENPVDILRWNLLHHQWQSAELEQQRPDLLMWPESSFFPALSVHAHRTEPDFLAITASTLRGLEFGGASRTSQQLDAATPAACISTGEERTWCAGAEGTVWKMSGSDLVMVAKGPEEIDWRTVAVQCSADNGLEGTSFQQCTVFVSGSGGTVGVLEENSVRMVQTDLPKSLTIAASLSLGDDMLLVAGAGLAAVVNTRDGALQELDLPEAAWRWAVSTTRGVTLVAADGLMAELGSQSPTQHGRPEALRGQRLVGVSTLDGERVLLATNKGLYTVGDDGTLQYLALPGAVSVACDGIGLCACATEHGTLKFLHGYNIAPFELELEDTTNLFLTAIPPTRYLWWVPPDARRLHTSHRPLPAQGPYPGPVLADSLTPSADANSPQRGFRLPLLFGAIGGLLVDPDDPGGLQNHRYNSAFLLDEWGVVKGRYDKQYLLAFGEYIPGGETFPWLYDLIPESGAFRAGPNTMTLDYQGNRLGILICYEDLISSHTRSVVNQGAQVLLNLTNDAWFGKTKEPDQHFVLASFRAIEYRRALVRATSTGVSGVILPSGRISARTGIQDPESFVQSVPLRDEPTVYARFGYLFPWVLLLAGALFVLQARRRRESAA